MLFSGLRKQLPYPCNLCVFWSLQRIWARDIQHIIIGSLSKDVFEGRTSTGSEPFSLFICLDANKFVLLSFFSLIKRIYPRVSNKPLPNDAKGPLPVDVRRSTTLLLKLPNVEQRYCISIRKTHKSGWLIWTHLFIQTFKISGTANSFAFFNFTSLRCLLIDILWSSKARFWF